MELSYGQATGSSIILDQDESHHLTAVRRMKHGDEVMVTNGDGMLYTTVIDSIEKKTTTLRILSSEVQEKKPFSLHIAIAPTKHIDRIEWFIEKATEIGIDEVSFIRCRYSERKE